MSLHLILTAPKDLSVGRVRLIGQREIGAWVASPTETQHHFEGLDPGVYQAVAEPLGLPSRSFFFVLKDDNEQFAMPTLQAMSSPGFAISNLASVVQAAAGPTLRSIADAVQPALKAIVQPNESLPVALGLSSCADFEKGRMRPYVSGLAPQVTLIEGAVDVILDRPSNARIPDCFDVVLTCAVSGGRNLFGRVPLFKGGVRITLSASPLGNADLTCRIYPFERSRRAITQALFAGSSTEAAPVFKTLPGGPDELIGKEDWRDDPWTSVAAGLLCRRFPDHAPDSLPIDLSALATTYPSLPDVHVLLAHQRLRQAAKTTPNAPERSVALDEVLTHVERGYAAGPPYFAYAAQLAQEMLLALATDPALAKRCNAQLAKLRRYVQAPRNAAASHVWWSEEIPARPGTLDPHAASVVFSGWVNHDQIALNPEQAPSVASALAQVASPVLAAAAKVVPKLQSIAPDTFGASWDNALAGLRELGASALSLVRGAEAPASAPVAQSTDPPGLGRPVTVPDDPHKGRFGEVASSGGFTLAAEFGDGEDAKLVRINLSVTGGEGFDSYDDVAEFFLHPTFRPDRLRAAFHGRKAEVQIVAWGGFTVGAWLPEQKIELELDLAKLPGAPKVVREL